MFKTSCVPNNYFPNKKLLKTIIILLAKDFPMSVYGSEGMPAPRLIPAPTGEDTT